MTRGPITEPWQASYLRRAIKLRKRLTNKALAARLNLSVPTVDRYGNGRRGRG
jgi:hypothetical protein